MLAIRYKIVLLIFVLVIDLLVVSVVNIFLEGLGQVAKSNIVDYCWCALLLFLKISTFLFQFKENYLLLLKIIPEEGKNTSSLPTGLAKIHIFSYVMLWFLPSCSF